MDTVSIKLENKFLKDIEETMKRHRYSTKTEFIREAIRDKISDLEKEAAKKRALAMYGASKRKTTDRQRHAAGEAAFEEISKQFK